MSSSNFFDTISNYQSISKIVNDENTRLQSKEQSVNNAYQNQQRLILLNQSYGERMQAYSLIILVVIVIIVVSFGISYLASFVGESISMLLKFLVILIGGIYIFYLYIGIQARDKVNYNKLALAPPPTTSGNVLVTSGKITSDIGSLLSLDKSICGTGSAWTFNSAGKCECKAPSIYTAQTLSGGIITPANCVANSFTTISDANEHSVNVNHPTEYNSYSPYP